MIGAVVHGLDVGTSTSSIMVMRRSGDAPVAVRDPASPSGATATPTAVCALPDGALVVGAAAEHARRTRPQGYRAEFKREFGDGTASRLGERAYRPDELVALVIGFLREQALARVPGEPERVAVTVPAAWERGNRDLMLDAAVAAGYPRERVLLRTEPVAAAAYACANREAAAGTDLVYDLGGGTFDVAVARATAAGHEVLGAPDGLGDVGGAEFDRLVLHRIRAAYPTESAALFDPAGDDEPVVLRRRLDLRDLCEQLKRQLSVTDAPSDLLTPIGVAAVFELRRPEFAELVGPLLDETLDVCERLLGTLGLSWADLDTVVPVGGSSRLPLVGELLAKRSGRPVAVVDAPELAIVHGAALLAAADAWPPDPVTAEPEPEPEPPPASPPAPEPESPPAPEPPTAPPRRFDPNHNPFDEY